MLEELPRGEGDKIRVYSILKKLAISNEQDIVDSLRLLTIADNC